MQMHDEIVPPVLDDETVAALLDALEDDVYELFDEFVLDVTQELENIQSLVETSNWQELAAVTHTLKGCGGNLGASSFADACQCLENTLKEGDYASVEQRLGSLSVEFDKTKIEMGRLGAQR